MATMADHEGRPESRNSMRCQFCSKGFLHSKCTQRQQLDLVSTVTKYRAESSLTRHVKRCSQPIKGPPRRKACKQCATSKLRCDLEKPHCGSCQDRAITCEFESLSGSASPRTANAAGTPTPSVITEQSLVNTVRAFAIKRQRELKDSAPDTLRGSSETAHAIDLTIRVLRSWARQVAIYKLEQLPPMIHRVQLEHGTPQPLTNCCLLAAMWANSNDDGGKLVSNCVLREMQRLLTEVSFLQWC